MFSSSLFVFVFIFLLFPLNIFGSLPNVRPSAADRKFSSPAIDALINQIRPLFLSNDLGILFSNAYPNTLDTTVAEYNFSIVDDVDSYLITGDINAQWLRDSTNQILPYEQFFSQGNTIYPFDT